MPAIQPWPQAAVGNIDHTRAAVVIIGAGISGWSLAIRLLSALAFSTNLVCDVTGICTAIDLITRNYCHNIVIVEKSAGVGGTWYDNKYPGCCCDGEYTPKLILVTKVTPR